MKKGYLYTMLFFASMAAFASGKMEDMGVVNKTVKVVNPGDYNFNCNKFGKGEDSLKSIEYYSLYREFFKQENYELAMKYWPYVYKVAPTLNSRVITNGITYYEMLIEAHPEEGPRKDELVDSLIMLYFHKLHCYDKELSAEIKTKSKIGWLYQTYRPDATEEIKRLYGEVIMKAKNDAPYYTIEPFFKYMLIDLDNGKITPTEVLDMKETIEGIIAANSEDETFGPQFQQLGDVIADLFENNPKVIALFDCEAMMPTWKDQYKTQSQDLSFVNDIYRKMNSKKCQGDPFTQELKMKLIELDPTAPRMMYMASLELKVKNYDAAIPWIEKAIDLETDKLVKADYIFKIAELKYVAHDFPAARTYAKKVIDLRPNWGKPYILIGKLYASSGKLCGPGAGFESQKVIWPALDYFLKAKQVDESATDDANALINKYSAYLPAREELFMMGINNGDSYYVGCWIKENTTVRTK